MKSHDQINGNLLKTYSDCQSFLFFKSVKYASSASYSLCLLHMIVIFFIPQSIVVLFLLASVFPQLQINRYDENRPDSLKKKSDIAG